MKLIVYVEHGIGGTRAWVNTDVEIDDMIVVVCPADNLADAEAVDAATLCLDRSNNLDGFDQPISTGSIETRISTERIARFRRETAGDNEE